MPVYPSDLNAGAEVYSSDGHKLGNLNRAVLKRSDLSLTHVVVDIGFLRSGRPIWQGGFGLDYDRVVPVESVGSVTPERIDLLLRADEFKDLPEYTEEHYDQPYDMTPDEFDLPDVATRLQMLNAMIGNTSGLWLHERLNKPLDSVDVEEGTAVWRQEPHEKLGEVHRLLFDETDGHLRAFVISRGFIFKQEVVLPARYITELYDDVVRVQLSDEELEKLREYREA